MSDIEKIKAVFEVVRDIPYGDIGSRDPMKVLEERKGTCSGKHILLGKLYESMGVRVQYMMCSTTFNHLKDMLPDDLKEILLNNEIHDYHNYLRIFTDRWIDVDATFDLPLLKYGFPVNSGWDGESDCRIAFDPIDVFKVDDLVTEKEKAVGSMTEDMQKIREDFIKRLSVWMDSIR